MNANRQLGQSMKALLIMAWILLFIWIAWASQSGPAAPRTPETGPGPREEDGRIEARAPAGSTAAPLRSLREPVVAPPDEAGTASDELEEKDAVLSLDELPVHLSHFIRGRVVPNINNALRAEGLEELDAPTLAISVNTAEEAVKRYKAIWASGRVYDEMMEERIDALMATNGPGTGVLDVSDWPAVTTQRMHEALTLRLGRDIKELQRNRRTRVRWRKEGPLQVRFGVFEPGTDAVLDSLHDAYDLYLRTTIRFSLIELAEIFRKK